MGSFLNLVNNFKVKEVIFNCGEYNELEMELIKLLDEKNIKYSKRIDKLNTLKFLNTKIYRTDEDGEIIFKIKNNELQIKKLIY